jgi:hypothetical protein
LIELREAIVTACPNLKQQMIQNGQDVAFVLGDMHLLMAISKTRNTGTTEHGTPEQHHSGTRNTGTLKILNLLKIRKKIPGCVKILVQ